MSKILQKNTNRIIYDDVELGEQSSVESFYIQNEGTENITVSSITFPLHFKGKIKDVGSFAVSIGAFELPHSFVVSQKYFMDLSGKLTTDETITGIYMGEGHISNGLLIKAQVCLQDEDGYILEDEVGNFLEDV